MRKIFAVATILAVCFQIHGQIITTDQAGHLRLKTTDLKKYDSLKWVISSDRNAPVSRMRDRSYNAPDDYTYPPEQPGRQIWFPIVDIQLRPGIALVASFEEVGSKDSICFNGNFLRTCHALKRKISFVSHLEHWENQLFVKSETAVLKAINLEVPMCNDELSLKPLSSYWSGEVAALGYTEDKGWVVIDKKKVSVGQAASPAQTSISTISKDVVKSRLASASEYLMHSRNLNPYSPTYGGLFLFYDLESDTYRRSDWMWSFGPSIKVLLEAAEISDLSLEFSSEELMTGARQVAEASLRFQQTEEDHPAHGLVMCRYDPRTDSPQGAEGYYSPADSYFLAGWGWMPYYKATGDERFLNATALMTKGIDRIIGPDSLDANGKRTLVEQDYLMKAEKWKNWTMDESGFGMKGAEELYAETKDPYHLAVGKKYIGGLLDYLERPDGLWDRTYHRNEASRADNGWPVGAPEGTPVLFETKYSTRGLGWAMIGLLATHGMMPEGNVYLEKAIKLSDHLMKYQAEDGHWDFLFAGGYEGEVSEKGTALWSLLFYQLYDYTKDPRHLEVARNALLWCINNQYTGPKDSPIYGGIMGKNRESGVVYRRWSPLICSYTVAWYGLALLEELKLQNANVVKPN